MDGRRVTRSSARSALGSLQITTADASAAPESTSASKRKAAPPGSPSAAAKAPKKPPAPTPKSSEPENCTICMDLLGTENGVCTLACMHAFCRTCLATHAARQSRHNLPPSCPLCKRECLEREIEECGEPKELEEESEHDESEGVMVLVEFEGEDGEQGFWVERTEKRRRQLLLEAQDALAATSQWTREIFTLPSTDGAEAEGSSDEPLRGRLEEWLSRGKQAIAAQAEAHAAEVQQVRDGAAQLLEDLARLKKAGAAGAEEVNAVRKAREVAFPSVKLMPAPGVNPVKAPQDGTTMSAVAEKAEPTAGLLTL